MLLHETASGGAADLNRLEFLVADDAAADLVDDFPYCDTHGDFNKTGVFDFPREGEHLCALGLFRPHGCEAFGTLEHDPRHVCPCLHVVDVRGLAPETLDRRERWPGPGHSPLSLDGCHESRFLAAHKGTCAFLDMQVEAEVRPQDVCPQEAVFGGLVYGRLESLDGQGIFRAAVNISFVGSHGIGADHHAFQNGVGIALKNGPVHECPWVAFVGVADDVFLVSRGSRAETPLETCGETAAAPPAKARFFHFLDDRCGRHFGDAFSQGLVSVPGNILVDVVRVDIAAVAEDNSMLFPVEGDFLVMTYFLC